MNEMIDNQNNIPPFIKGETDKVSYCGYTCIGGRPEDQDCLEQDNVNGRQIFIVCDGMGGHAGGCIASATAAAALKESFRRQAVDVVPTKEAMMTAVTEANTAVYRKSQEEPSLRGMGTTLTLLVIDSKAAYVTHIGDSRIYQLRKGRKVYRTFDQSMVFEQIVHHVSPCYEFFNCRLPNFLYSIIGKKKHKKTKSEREEEARQHPRSNVLSKAIGILPDVEVVVTKLDYRAKDRFILCCDGVWNTQPEPEVIQMFIANADLETTIRSTQSLVEKIGKENGGQHDNHTMIAVDMKCDSKYRKSIFTKLKSLFKRSV